VRALRTASRAKRTIDDRAGSERAGPRTSSLRTARWLWPDPTQRPVRVGQGLGQKWSGRVDSMFLGALLGWLRLASKSVLPTTLANSMLTVTAGLPLFLHGEDPGPRGAAYEPAGWIPMLIAVVILACKFRGVVRLPSLQSNTGPGLGLRFVAPESDGSSNRTLH
jgi:hypothetical protein